MQIDETGIFPTVEEIRGYEERYLARWSPFVADEVNAEIVATSVERLLVQRPTTTGLELASFLVENFDLYNPATLIGYYVAISVLTRDMLLRTMGLKATQATQATQATPATEPNFYYSTQVGHA